MVDDVIDIRKRIEKIRNEVSEAIVFQKNVNFPNEDVNSEVSFSVEPVKNNEKDFKIEKTKNIQKSNKDKNSDDIMATHKGIIHSMSLPSFNLNIKNKHSSQLLIILISLQILTNAFLLLILFYRL